MRKVAILGPLVVVIMGQSQVVLAESKFSPAMEHVIKKLNTLSGVELCTQKWNLLWPLAKKGDLAARAYLAMSMGPMMHTDTTIPPGRSGDYVSRWRDVQIMTVHSLGASLDNSEGDKMFYSIAHSVLDRTMHHKFNQCMAEERYKECAAIAVDEKSVPPFESYVIEIDALTAQGLKPTCQEDGYNRPSSGVKE